MATFDGASFIAACVVFGGLLAALVGLLSGV